MGALWPSFIDADGVKNDFVPIAGETRICLNILHEGNQTELLESGPQIAPGRALRRLASSPSSLRRLTS